MADEKRSQDGQVATSDHSQNIEKGPPADPVEVVPQKVLTDDEETNRLYAQFAAADEDWHKKFEKKLMRKVDLRLVPLLVIMYINNFIDRSALGQARLGTLEEDLGMDPDGTQFNTAISILFVGYLTMQLPSNLLLSRLRPSVYLGSTMMVWGAVCASTAAVQNYGSLLAVRVFLGVTEAPFFPVSLSQERTLIRVPAD